MLVQKLGLSMLDAKGIVMHLVGENNGCCRHRCGGQIVGDVKSRVASCAKCGAANLGV